MEVPEFVRPREMLQLSDEQVDALVEGMRERRLHAYKVYQEAERQKALIQNEKDQAKYAKMLEMFEKEHATAEKALTKLEERIKKIRAMSMDLDLQDMMQAIEGDE